MKKSQIVLAIALGILTPNVMLAGGGENIVSVNGMIIDQVSGEALPGVKVNVEGTGIYAYTDFDGNFTISGVKPGEYNVSVSLVSYEDKTLSNVKVAPNQPNVKIEMKGK